MKPELPSTPFMPCSVAPRNPYCFANAVNGALQPGSAVLFTPDSGDFAGRTFAVVDADGDGNYQVGLDYVFEFSNPVEPPTSFNNLFF